MDAFATRNHRAVLQVSADGKIDERLGGKYFKHDVLPLDAYGNRYLYPGMILALSGSYYVPYNAGAAYGTGSDTAIGILNEFWDMTLYAKIVSPVTEGTFIEDYCYVEGGDLGTVPAGVKTALSHVQWK